jgi:hypothetical protein
MATAAAAAAARGDEEEARLGFGRGKRDAALYVEGQTRNGAVPPWVLCVMACVTGPLDEVGGKAHGRLVKTSRRGPKICYGGPLSQRDSDSRLYSLFVFL